MTSPVAFLARVGDASAPLVLPPVAAMPDAELLDAQRAVAEVQRRVATIAASIAGEIAHRSRRALGHSGLAASRGQRNAEGLISQLTGGSTREARTLVTAGELLPVATSRPDAPPVAAWLRVIGDAVGGAAISVQAAGVIRSRLAATRAAREGGEHAGGDAASAAALAALDAAARALVAASPRLTLEQLAIRAGAVRDELDAEGVAERERHQHERRFLRLTPQPDGMVRLSDLLDRESAAIVVPVIDALTSPRRPGPRFAKPHAPTAADLVRETRSPEQLVLDSVVELIRLGSRCDDGRLLGDRKPAVRIVVTARELNAATDSPGGRPGAAYFEGQSEPVSVATAERFIWDEHRGRTDVDDGVLLCRHCHLLLHNRGWRIRRTGGDYALERPDADGILRRTPLPTRSPAVQRMRKRA